MIFSRLFCLDSRENLAKSMRQTEPILKRAGWLCYVSVRDAGLEEYVRLAHIEFDSNTAKYRLILDPRSPSPLRLYGARKEVESEEYWQQARKAMKRHFQRGRKGPNG